VNINSWLFSAEKKDLLIALVWAENNVLRAARPTVPDIQHHQTGLVEEV